MTIITAALSSLISFMFPVQRGQTEDYPLPLKAVPGLTSVLDLALFRSNEGQLTATICSSHVLLKCWLDLKKQAQIVIQLLKQEDDVDFDMDEDENDDEIINEAISRSNTKALYESFSRQCLESACDAIERLSTDRLAQAANLSDPYDSIASATHGTGTSSSGGHHHHSYPASMTSGVGVQGISNGILESKEETGRRQPIQRRKDCWESPTLFCPDYVWADDAYSACQRWIRSLDKHPYMTTIHSSTLDTPVLATGSGSGSSSKKSASFVASASNLVPLRPVTERQMTLLMQLVKDDLPTRLYQFKQATEAEVVVTKRLYLVKCEYRVPFRSFLEAHQSLLRAPPIELVDYYLNCNGNNNNNEPEDLKAKFQSLLNKPELIELLALEMEGERIEQALGEAIFPFSELARTLDHKRARLKVVSGVVEYDELPILQESVRRLKYVLCRKSGSSETSTGIRPILLDLQNVPRDDEPGEIYLFGIKKLQVLSPYEGLDSLEKRIDKFISQLTILSTLVKTKNAFVTTKTNASSNRKTDDAIDIDFSLPVVNGCTEEYDPELLKCRLLDWFTIVDRQHILQQSNMGLAEEIRNAEMKMSIAGATAQSLQMVKERLETIQVDRQQRFTILKEMIEEVCLREMNLYANLICPEPNETLELRTTSAQGFLTIPLELAGESLPLR